VAGTLDVSARSESIQVQRNGAIQQSAALAPIDVIVGALKRAGVDLVTSLPDKWLNGLIAAIDADGSFTHLRITREEEGLGICAGAHIGGRKGVLICQTAGLLLSVNTLAAYVHLHRLPVLILAAHRGTVEDQFFFQMYKGQVIEGVLDAISVKHFLVTAPEEAPLVEDAVRYAELQRAPVVVLLGRRVLTGG
jgi:sulfopyruvate decarboxylase subunit alpha